MAADADDKTRAQSDPDDLSALGPQQSESSPPPAQDDAIEAIDAAALSALSLAGGRTPKRDSQPEEAIDLWAAKVALARDGGRSPSSQSPADTGTSSAQPVASAAQANANKAARDVPASTAAAQSHPAAVRSTAAGASNRWLLPLAIGVGIGALVSALALSNRAAPAGNAVDGDETNNTAAAKETAATEASAPAAPSAITANAPQPSAAAEPDRGQAPPPSAASPIAAAQAARTPRAESAERASAKAEAAPPGAPRAKPVAAANVQQPSPASASDETPSGHEDDSEDAKLAAAAKPKASENALDSMLDDALSNGSGRNARDRAGKAQSTANAVPVTPSAEEITKAMGVLVPAIRGCAQGQSGMASVGMVLRNDGRVESVTVDGPPFAGTASGRCMEGVVRRARFPRFTQATFRLRFPFALQ